jgi:hypothetical protein
VEPVCNRTVEPVYNRTSHVTNFCVWNRQVKVKYS